MDKPVLLTPDVVIAHKHPLLDLSFDLPNGETAGLYFKLWDGTSRDGGAADFLTFVFTKNDRVVFQNNGVNLSKWLRGSHCSLTKTVRKRPHTKKEHTTLDKITHVTFSSLPVYHLEHELVVQLRQDNGRGGPTLRAEAFARYLENKDDGTPIERQGEFIQAASCGLDVLMQHGQTAPAQAPRRPGAAYGTWI